MRSIALTVCFFIIAALLWVFHLPLSSRAYVRLLSDPAADHAECEDALRRAGNGAIIALRQGLLSATGSASAKLSCARLLALCGEHDGDRYLLKSLRMHSRDTLGAKAEMYLISVWEQRDAPETATLARLTRLDVSPSAKSEILLSDTLLQHPGWSHGYVWRARMNQHNSKNVDARRDALTALLIEPDNFEAMIALSEAYVALNSLDQAYLCLERALRINPRLRETLKKQIQDVLKALELEKTRQRRELRMETPVTATEPRTPVSGQIAEKARFSHLLACVALDHHS